VPLKSAIVGDTIALSVAEHAQYDPRPQTNLSRSIEGFRARERRRQDVAEQLAGARQDAPRRFDRVELRAELRQRLKYWRRLLLRNVPEARALPRLMRGLPAIV
jgi:hypothetical protein